LSFAKKIEQVLARIEKTGIVLILSLMVGLSFAQVALRLFFSMSLLWADTFLRHLVLWAGLLGACVAAAEGSHFAIDILKKRVPASLKRPLSVFTNISCVFVLAVLSKAAWSYFRDDLETQSALFSIGALHVPTSWMTLIIPVGFTLLAVHFFLAMFSEKE